jgi:hypothetical protein
VHESALKTPNTASKGVSILAIYAYIYGNQIWTIKDREFFQVPNFFLLTFFKIEKHVFLAYFGEVEFTRVEALKHVVH